MKKLNILILFVVALAGCDEFENSAEKSKITYLPVLTINGEADIELACNASGFTDPGAEALEGGESIDVTTTVTGQYFGGTVVGQDWVYDDDTTVDGPDVYEYYYSAANVDGIPAAAFRHVVVPACNDNLTTGIAGTYLGDVVRTLDGSPAPGATGPYSDVGPIMIKNLGGGVYQISDALGGWYEHGRAFGYTGAAPGIRVTVNNLATNSFSFSGPVKDLTFGDLAQVIDFDVDPVAGTIVYKTEWAGYVFTTTLTPVD